MQRSTKKFNSMKTVNPGSLYRSARIEASHESSEQASVDQEGIHYDYLTIKMLSIQRDKRQKNTKGAR